MFDHKFLNDLPLYACGALSGSDKQILEEHLAQGCEICEPELYAFQETATRLPFALTQKTPPKKLEMKILETIRTEEKRKGEFRINKYVAAVAAIVAAMLITGGVLWQQNLQLVRKDRDLAKMREAIEQQEREIQWLRDPAVQLALLSGLDPAPEARGKMVWNPEVARGIFYANALPSLSNEKSYQLWVIGEGGPVSAGLVEPDARGSAVVIISRLPSRPAGPLQFAVTIEPRGGRPQPSGSMVLAGKTL